MSYRLFAVVLMLLGCSVLRTGPAQAQLNERQPNIILIFCDDLGFGDLGTFWQNERAEEGHPAHATPHIDALARDGVRMTGTYCPAPVCAPSRSSLLLGVTQGHANVRDNQFDKALEDNHTLASVLREAGYATAVFGKWGLQGKGQPGIENIFPAHPMNRGFDYFLGYIRHRDGHMHYPKEDQKELYDGATNIADQLDLCYTTDLFTARLKQWIVDQHAATPDKPFFAFLSYDTPHAILQNPPCAYPEGGGLKGGVQWLGEPGRMINTAQGTYSGWMHPEYADEDWPEQYKIYANSVRRIDDSVGDVRVLLEDLGIAENTLVVFTSDNGPSKESYLPDQPYSPQFFRSYGPFDGIKRDLWEGGIRPGAIAAWPSRIPPEMSVTTPCTFADFMATFTDAAGTQPPARADGVSMIPAMTGLANQAPANIYIEYTQNGRTPRYGDFDSSHRNRKRGQMQMIRLSGLVGVRYDIKSHADDFEIYDILNDPQQTTNLAGQADMAELQQQMKDEVLRRRMPDETAPRPYDNEPVPAVEVGETKPGLVWSVYDRHTSYVPQVTGLEPADTRVLDTVLTNLADFDAAMHYEALLEVPETGVYTFQIDSDFPAVLRLHACLVIDGDRPFIKGRLMTGTIHLEKGKHPVRLTYSVDAEQEGNFALSWSGPSFELNPILPAWWSHTAE